MLSNHYIGEILPSELWDRYSALEIEMILALALMARDMEFSTLWKTDRLIALAALRNELQGIIQGNWHSIQKTLSRTLEQAGFKALATNERILKAGVAAGIFKAPVAIKESKALQRKLAAGYDQIVNRLQVINKTAVSTTVAAMDEAYALIASGAFSLEAGVEKAINDLATRGVTGRVTVTQRKMEVAPYVRQVVQSGVSFTALDLCFERMREYGTDLIIVSAHAGARLKCFPYQGRVYSLSGNHPKYPSLSSTSYGEPDGLFGINCHHFYDPFIEGLDRHMTREERDPARFDLGKSNAKVYEERQRQRYNERKIREWKRKESALKEAGIDPARANRKVRAWQQEQRQFLEGAGRTRRFNREQAR